MQHQDDGADRHRAGQRDGDRDHRDRGQQPAQLGADGGVAAVEPPAHRRDGADRGDGEGDHAGGADAVQGRAGAGPARRVGDAAVKVRHRPGLEGDGQPDRGPGDGHAADGPAPAGTGHVAVREPQQGKQETGDYCGPQPAGDPGAGQGERPVMIQAVNHEDVQCDRRGAQHAEAGKQPGETVLMRRAVRVAAPGAQHERGQQRERWAGDQVDPGVVLHDRQVHAARRRDGERGRQHRGVDDRDGDRGPRPGRTTLAGPGCCRPCPHRRIVAWPGRLCHGHAAARR